MKPETPDDLTPEAILKAKDERGLSYKDIADAAGVTVQAVWAWTHHIHSPLRRYHDALRRVLYGQTQAHDSLVWLRHSGNKVKGRVETVTGRGADIVFHDRKGREIVKNRIPYKDFVLLGTTWADHAVRSRGLGERLADAAVLARDGHVTLDTPDFETQALANTVDRFLGELAVDRGGWSAPRYLVSEWQGY